MQHPPASGPRSARGKLLKRFVHTKRKGENREEAAGAPGLGRRRPIRFNPLGDAASLTRDRFPLRVSGALLWERKANTFKREQLATAIYDICDITSILTHSTKALTAHPAHHHPGHAAAAAQPGADSAPRPSARPPDEPPRPLSSLELPSCSLCCLGMK
uniref:Uncharacterized protein n=1 Tax=Rangifer tarandus platyrhynchus TaxID=3082113 RepID=A0ACB0F486_RANTA|nr:unnamed protein product [Rangifer tarandus platyrhynchus]